ncbi:uncharacterized protein LY89DRAFT_732613 [Mollisia scopiformis]|uniref:Pal1-like protein n=1 Tax=Mollisia scopiformis TaxID=149040 RepID=A0A194XCK0_MOLSC|nr:uncharacterized protein LY89DRAFT_732613 [Mollisia scopiformis]KUJ17903.1 hypothetical protein LY89DRAFT_732613 [Mollisia scopiformis]
MEPSSSAARALTARTVHLKLYPTPRTFPERREVLRVLERFGEVSMFRSLKYNRKNHNPVHNAFLALFTTSSSATDLLNASPLRYRLVTSPSEPSSPDPQTTTFSLNASPTTWDHQAGLTGSQNPLHGPFRPISPRYSYVGSSLERVVPESLWSRGLLDWETDKGEEVVDGKVDGVRMSVSGEGIGRRVAGLQNWDAGKIGEGKRPEIMKGLRRFLESREGIRGEKGTEGREG